MLTEDSRCSLLKDNNLQRYFVMVGNRRYKQFWHRIPGDFRPWFEDWYNSCTQPPGIDVSMRIWMEEHLAFYALMDLKEHPDSIHNLNEPDMHEFVEVVEGIKGFNERIFSVLDGNDCESPDEERKVFISRFIQAYANFRKKDHPKQ